MPTTKIQGSDVKSVSDLSNDKTKLITTEKIYDVNNSKTLAEAITDGDIGGGGTGGGGALNFYDGGDADNAEVGDFSTGNDSVFDGGGTLQGAFSISTTAADLISGSSVFKLVLNASAGNSNDDYVASQAISIPQGYRGRQLVIKLQYKYSGNDSDINWSVKDNTNGDIIKSVSMESFSGSDNVAQQFSFSFFCPSDCQELQIGPQISTHSSGSEVLLWDDVIVSPDLLLTANIDNITDWESYTPIGNASNDASVTRSGYFRRVGDSIEGVVKFAISGALSSTIQIGIPSGLEIDTDKMEADNQNASIGIATAYDSSAGSYSFDGRVTYWSGGGGIKFLIQDSAGTVSNWGGTIPFTFASGDELYCTFTVPIKGWSSTSTNIITPTDCVAPVRYTSDASQSFPNGSVAIVNFEDKDFDDQGLVTTGGSWNYLVPMDGYYSVNAGIRFNSTSWTNDTIFLQLTRNGTPHSAAYKYTGSSFTNDEHVDFSDIIYCQKGDTLDMRLHQNSGSARTLRSDSTTNYISIVKIDKSPLASVPKAMEDESGNYSLIPYWFTRLSSISSGDYTSGELIVERQGRRVTIQQLTTLAHPSTVQATSAAGLLPEWARPSTTTINVYQTGFEVFVFASGAVRSEYTAARTDSSTGLSITYLVD